MSVPDIKGYYSWSTAIEKALGNAKETIHSHVEMLNELSKQVEIMQSKVEVLSQDEDYAGVIWLLIDIE